MDSKFRSLPLSLIDLFGVLLPGLTWVILLATLREMFNTSPRAITPMVAFAHIKQTVLEGNPWFGGATLVLVALLIGYIAKPRAMHLATKWPIQLLPTDADRTTDKPKDKQFPYRGRHCDKPYFAFIEALTKELTNCSSEELPGPQPFGVIKRLLRLIAPPLWEELEHREAEVRLLGGLFLSSVFSALLGLTEIVRESAVGHRPSLESAVWLGVSVIIALLAGDGFGHLRRREVEFAYLHTILAINARKNGLWGPKWDANDTPANPEGMPIAT